jgi:hypothetical protein
MNRYQAGIIAIAVSGWLFSYYQIEQTKKALDLCSWRDR